MAKRLPQGYTPLCPQCGRWFLVAQELERELDATRVELDAERARLRDDNQIVEWQAVKCFAAPSEHPGVELLVWAVEARA